MTDNNRHAFVNAPSGKGFATPARGSLTFLATGDETGGAATVFESRIEPGEGPPVHLHLREDELIYVIEGRLRVRLGETIEGAAAGSLIFLPRGVPHAWQNVGDDAARFLAWFTPAAPGMERFFERAADLPSDQRLADAFGSLADDAGMVVVGPPLAQSDYLAEGWGVRAIGVE
jgi:quercetin dioxygenase-like cupin family protein